MVTIRGDTQARAVTGASSLAVSATDKRGQLISEFLMIFTHPKFEIQNGDIPDIQNSPNIA
jgi:hypothetical protein